MLTDFLASEHARERCWARSLVGWRRIGAARPNDAHRAIAALEARGRVEQLVMQNGDAALEGIDFERFDVPDCAACGGLLKPDVVFFGKSVSGERLRRAFASLDRADAMLVVGSSLMVHSGYRFAKAMAEAGKPIAAVNIGTTRADGLLALKVEERCTDALSFLPEPTEGKGPLACIEE